MTQKGIWNIAREKRLQDRGALPSEEGDVIREYKAMHEENFLSSWLREDLAGKEGRREKEVKNIREEVRKKSTREEEKEGRRMR